jgi:hypothetical protein
MSNTGFVYKDDIIRNVALPRKFGDAAVVEYDQYGGEVLKCGGRPVLAMYREIPFAVMDNGNGSVKILAEPITEVDAAAAKAVQVYRPNQITYNPINRDASGLSDADWVRLVMQRSADIVPFHTNFIYDTEDEYDLAVILGYQSVYCNYVAMGITEQDLIDVNGLNRVAYNTFNHFANSRNPYEQVIFERYHDGPHKEEIENRFNKSIRILIARLG